MQKVEGHVQGQTVKPANAVWFDIRNTLRIHTFCWEASNHFQPRGSFSEHVLLKKKSAKTCQALNQRTLGEANPSTVVVGDPIQ